MPLSLATRSTPTLVVRVWRVEILVRNWEVLSNIPISTSRILPLHAPLLSPSPPQSAKPPVFWGESDVRDSDINGGGLFLFLNSWTTTAEVILAGWPCFLLADPETDRSVGSSSSWSLASSDLELGPGWLKYWSSDKCFLQEMYLRQNQIFSEYYPFCWVKLNTNLRPDNLSIREQLVAYFPISDRFSSFNWLCQQFHFCVKYFTQKVGRK